MKNAKSLKERAVRCKHWRWMPGMRWTLGEDYGRVQDEQDGALAGALPDLDDPATRGCLLALVREALADPDLCVSSYETPQNRSHKISWEVDCVIEKVRDTHKLWDFGSEAEALVAALEAAGR